MLRMVYFKNVGGNPIKETSFYKMTMLFFNFLNGVLLQYQRNSLISIEAYNLGTIYLIALTPIFDC